MGTRTEGHTADNSFLYSVFTGTRGCWEVTAGYEAAGLAGPVVWFVSMGLAR